MIQYHCVCVYVCVFKTWFIPGNFELLKRIAFTSNRSEISLGRSVSNFRLSNPKLSEIRRYILLHTQTQTDSVFNCSITRIKTTDKKSRYINIYNNTPLHHSYSHGSVNLLLDHFRTGNIYEYDRPVLDSSPISIATLE